MKKRKLSFAYKDDVVIIRYGKQKIEVAFSDFVAINIREELRKVYLAKINKSHRYRKGLDRFHNLLFQKKEKEFDRFSPLLERQ